MRPCPRQGQAEYCDMRFNQFTGFFQPTSLMNEGNPKNKRKLVLVNPVNPVRTGLEAYKSSRYPPIGLGIVAALTPEQWDIVLLDENWKPFTYQDASLVGVTAFTPSANRAYESAAICGCCRNW